MLCKGNEEPFHGFPKVLFIILSGEQYASRFDVDCLKRMTSRSACREKEILMPMLFAERFIKTQAQVVSISQ